MHQMYTLPGQTNFIRPVTVATATNSKNVAKCCNLLPKCCQNVAKMLPKCCQNVAKLLQNCCKIVAKLLPKCCKIVAKSLQNCCKIVSKSLQTEQLQQKKLPCFQHTKLNGVHGPKGPWCGGSNEVENNCPWKPLLNGHHEQPPEATGRWHQRDMLNMEPWCHGVATETQLRRFSKLPQHEI